MLHNSREHLSTNPDEFSNVQNVKWSQNDTNTATTNAQRKKADFHLRTTAMKPYSTDCFFRRKNAETIKILKEPKKSKKECCAFAAQSCRICLIAIRFFSISTADTLSHLFHSNSFIHQSRASYTGRSKRNAVKLSKFIAIFCAFGRRGRAFKKKNR